MLPPLMKRLAVIFFLFSLSEYQAQTFYAQDSIQKIEISFSQANWDYMMDTAKAGKEGYVMAQWVKVNGVKFDSVGVKYKGNSSYNPVAAKNPLHIALDEYKDQNYQGFTDIKLGNNYADPSLMREVLSYSILANYMDCSRSNFAKVYINGAYNGVYANTEGIGKKFYGEHFYSRNNTAFKCNPLVNPATTTKCNLKYLSSDSSAYQTFYELKTDAGWNELVKLCDTVSNHSSSLANNIDMDRFIWMLAFDNTMVNLDSYFGAFCQNYYLYKDNNRQFVPVIWDLNMSLGGFPFVGSTTVSLGSLNNTQLIQLSLNTHSVDPYWPMINNVISNPTYKRMYYAHAKTIMNEMIASGAYTNTAVQYQALIDTSVLSDPAKVYSYSQFTNALTGAVSVGNYTVPGIQTLMTARNAYLQAQPEFTAVAPTLTNVIVSTASPSLNNPVVITASINGAGSVKLGYRFNRSNKFTRLDMLDDGLHGDGGAGDNIYGVSLNLAANQMQYYVYAENNSAGVFSPARAEHEHYELKLFPSPLSGEIVINEFLANNNSDVTNEYHLHEDWIELYNNSNKKISLNNYYLSNKDNQRAMYAFPGNTTIDPHAYLTIWADEITSGTQLHANFTLDKDGDDIYLGNGLTTLLDQVNFGGQSKDVSYGRCPDGSGPFKALNYPSFGMSNCTVGIEELQNIGGMTIYPNPARNYLKVKSDDGLEHSLKIYNVSGQLEYESEMLEETTVNIENFSTGIYFIKCDQQVKKLIIIK